MPQKRSPSIKTSSARVLIVEDDEPTRDALMLKLASMDIRAAAAKDGEEAIQQIHQQPWDVIVVDILLPKQNGFTVLEGVRREPHCARATVFVFTNLSGAEHKGRALELGAHAFFEKTKMSLHDIAQKIAQALDKKQ